MTYKEKEQRRERDKQLVILTHSIAKQAVAFKDITYSEAIQLLEDAKNIVVRNMQRQRAEVPAEIRDKWGTVIEMSEAKASDTHGNSW